MKIKGVIAIVGMVTLLAFGAACGGGKDVSASDETGSLRETKGESSVVLEGAVGVPVELSQPRPADEIVAVAIEPSVSALPGPSMLQVTGGQAGIQVIGEGVVSLEPDLALLNIGVETTGDTVAEARQKAAEAMEAVVESVKAHGLEDRDIQTRSFNIWPRYDYQEVFEEGRYVGKEMLIGYQVSNSVSLKIRDLDAVGIVIDDASTAGGAATRIHGISFTVEDPKPFTDSLREEAVKDAMAKAQHFAGLTGVQVGRLVYIAEVGGGVPRFQDGAGQFFAEAAFAARAPTPIGGGELEIRLMVQVVFNIL